MRGHKISEDILTSPYHPLHYTLVAPRGRRRKRAKREAKIGQKSEGGSGADVGQASKQEGRFTNCRRYPNLKNLLRRRSSLNLFKKRTDTCRFFLREFGSMHGLPPATGEKVCSPFLTPLGASLSSAHCYRLLLLSVHLRLSSQEEESASSLSSPLPILAVVSSRRGAPPVLHYSSSRSRSIP